MQILIVRHGEQMSPSKRQHTPATCHLRDYYQSSSNPRRSAPLSHLLWKSSTKSPKLFFCDPNNGALTYELPEITDCHMESLTTNTTVIPITVWRKPLHAVHKGLNILRNPVLKKQHGMELAPPHV